MIVKKGSLGIILNEEEQEEADENLSIHDMWDKLLEVGVSEQTLQIVTDVAGYNEETLKSVLFSVSGSNSFSDL